jgi:tetratricopeptide (TPR) repeat protein
MNKAEKSSQPLIMKFLSFVPLFFAFAFTAAGASSDPSIDQLIGKLPPVEQFVDPFINDPLAKQFLFALKQRNYGTAMELSRQLAAKYPKSFAAQFVHAAVAKEMRNYPEAIAAFHKVLALRPDFAFAYFGLGGSEAGQRHFRAALSDFQQITRLDPSRDVGWIVCSQCAEKIGDQKLSLDYARRGTAAAPKSAAVWVQAAREESRSGNKQAAFDDTQRAKQLLAQSKHTTRRS